MKSFQRWILFFGCALGCGLDSTAFSTALGADLLSSKIETLQEELKLDRVSVKSMGGGDDVMLEGQVPSLEVSALAEETAKQYFSSVFNVLTVEQPSFSYQFHAALFKKAAEGPNGSRYLETLKEGSENDQPWSFLLFDNKEADTFKTELSSLAAQNLEFSTEVMEDTNRFRFASAEVPWEIQLKTVSMGNGCFKTSVKIFSAANAQPSQPAVQPQLLWEKTLACKQGEWVALSGLTKLLMHSEAGSNVNLSTSADVILLFQPMILSLSAP